MKRLLDFTVSLILIILLSPVILIISILVKITSRGPVFFRGLRVGKNGKEFKIFKFRSMIPNAEKLGKLNVSMNDSRVTKFGKFLRATKLDELPQLFNVMFGQMSLVGPRPDVRSFTDLYLDSEKKILTLKPGITDWASLVNINQYKDFSKVNDPDKIFLEHIRPIKVKLQLYYFDHHSFWADIEILLWTFFKVVFKSPSLPKKINTLIERDYN
jgi:lipopolysaccharide/colanic/teichoic acid biosynthesis glycosyltransferase